MPSDTTPLEPVGGWDVNHPLQRIRGETARAYRAFIDYWHCGVNRTAVLVLDTYRKRPETGPDQPPTRSVRTLRKWQQEYCWVARVARAEQLQSEMEERRWRQRQRELREAEWSDGEALRGTARDMLEVLPAFTKDSDLRVVDPKTGTAHRIVSVRTNMTIAQLSQALRTASELQRQAAGMDSRGAWQWQAKLDLTQLTEEQLERIAAGENVLSVLSTTTGSGGTGETPPDGGSGGGDGASEGGSHVPSGVH